MLNSLIMIFPNREMKTSRHYYEVIPEGTHTHAHTHTHTHTHLSLIHI